MNRNVEDAPLLTVQEAAQLLRIGRSLAYHLVARGEIPAIRLGKAIRIPRDALNEWVVEQTRGDASG